VALTNVPLIRLHVAVPGTVDCFISQEEISCFYRRLGFLLLTQLSVIVVSSADKLKTSWSDVEGLVPGYPIETKMEKFGRLHTECTHK
jgi:hypothetical protein